MRKPLVLLLAVCAALAAASPADARRIEDWPYEKLMKESDLVVIASAVKTEPAADKSPENGWKYDFAARNTTLKVLHALKGKAEGEIKVLHFGVRDRKDRPGEPDALFEDGPLFVTFRTKPVEAKVNEAKVALPVPEYLLWLKRLDDGRYEPVSGRIDPALSVRELSEPLDRFLGDGR